MAGIPLDQEHKEQNGDVTIGKRTNKERTIQLNALVLEVGTNDFTKIVTHPALFETQIDVRTLL